MSKMRAIEAAVLVMRREGVDTAFGIPGAAINPYATASSASLICVPRGESSTACQVSAQ